MTVAYNVKRPAEPSEMSTEPTQQKLSHTDVMHYEAMKDILLEHKAYWTRRLFEEREKQSPETEKVEALEAYVAMLRKEADSMRLGNKELEAKAKYIYAPLVKALMGRDK